MFGVFDIISILIGGPDSNEIDAMKEDMHSAIDKHDKKKIVKTTFVALLALALLIFCVVLTASDLLS